MPYTDCVIKNRFPIKHNIFVCFFFFFINYNPNPLLQDLKEQCFGQKGGTML